MFRGRKRVRYSSSGLADGQSLSTSLNQRRVKAGEEGIFSRSNPREGPGKAPGFDFPRRITATLL